MVIPSIAGRCLKSNGIGAFGYRKQHQILVTILTQGVTIAGLLGTKVVIH
ncbi:hypothetical protein HCH29_13675 [Enterococcus gilvus]|nr:hypothetical protein [Enterococcus gilvus]